MGISFQTLPSVADVTFKEPSVVERIGKKAVHLQIKQCNGLGPRVVEDIQYVFKQPPGHKDQFRRGLRFPSMGHSHWMDGDNSEDESDQYKSKFGMDEGCCGFNARECDELLMQGVKPWESDAEGVLGALMGDYY